MVLIRKKEITTDKIVYYYQPEAKGKEGVIVYFPKREYKRDRPDYEIEILAENDFKIEYKSSPYRVHTIYALRKFLEEGIFPDEKLIAWG